MLRVFGEDVTVYGQTVSSSRFGLQVVGGCDGIEAIALFTSAVLASPVSWRRRLPFILAGTAVLFVVNLLRIVSLYFAGVHFPQAMDRMHWELWPGLFIVGILGCWVVWARWAWRPGEAAN